MNLFSRILLILLAALLSRLSLPGFGMPHFVWVAMIPFFLAQRGVSHQSRAALGLLYGFAIWYLSIWWLPQGMTNWIGISVTAGVAATVLLCLYHAVPYLLFGYRAKWFADDEGMGGVLRDTVLLTVLLCICPAVFPGHGVIALYQSPLFIQSADLGGIPIVLFCVILINRCGADVIRRIMARINPLPPLATLAAVMAFIAIYGGIRLAQLDAEAATAPKEQTISIAAIQPDIPTHPANGDEQAAVAAAMVATEKDLRNKPALDIIIWPEMPIYLWCDNDSLRRFGFISHARTMNTPVLVNCIDTRAEKGKTGNTYNAAIMIDGQGVPAATYHKQILFPFAEYIPLELEYPLLRRLFPAVSCYRPGTEATVMDIDKNGGNRRRLIPLLCYEAIFSGPVRQAVKNGGNVIINMTDDAWFGRSNASEMHLSFLPFRAVEFRIPLVRANNSGISIFASATGEIMPGTKTGLFERAVIQRNLFIPKSRSLYFYIGDAFLYALMLGLGVDLMQRFRTST
jgi:apolipoprotein N-acyltransferase